MSFLPLRALLVKEILRRLGVSGWGGGDVRDQRAQVGWADHEVQVRSPHG